ncbi:AMP-binding protein [Dactylosporangium sp. NPDC050688]|uniref:AMP-binding protein n=1 Tax=Dactylosporangium sp. NPDC050688 TaxID=3157217 RepID=UPI0033F6E3E4
MVGVTAADTPECLTDLLLARRESPKRLTAIRGDQETSYSFAELCTRSLTASAALRDRAGTDLAGARVVICLADTLAFAVAFFGAVMAGAVPVPGPSRLGVQASHDRRLRAILRSAGPAAVVADSAAIGRVQAVSGGRFLVIDGAELNSAGPTPPGPDAPSPVAYLQYTSGSVSDPEPVSISSRNVVAQLAQAATVFAEDHGCVCVNWVPVYHDMGLVTSILRPLWSNYDSVLLDPMDFVRDPGTWLRAISRHRATHVSAPDFGYALCARKVTDHSGVELSSLRVARNAGEMVRVTTMEEFSNAFAPDGFRYEMFAPSYGLAEATLTVTTCLPHERPRLIPVSKWALSLGTVARPESEADAVQLVSAGPPLPGTSVWIQPDGGPATDRDRVLGEVVISGPQVAGDETTYATGDIGFLADGELVLIGRARHRFQVRGQNYYSTELEACVADEEPLVRRGRIAVFACERADRDQEVVVLAELRRGVTVQPSDEARAQAAIRDALRRAFGLTPDTVALVPCGSLPVTTSGKLERDRCRADYQERGSPLAAAPVGHSVPS